ncbi:MAG: hypothetical protein Q6361_00500, partial [Candidatus Hermodarchaeota archaeon]|nr:hypothetical protein [Candidatus Hermodarchaeota archaeon]
MAFLTLTLILATMLFVAPTIASDVSLAGGLIQLFGENPAHLSLETNVDHFLNSTQYRQVADSVSGVDGFSHVEIVAHRLTFERYFFAINNDSKIFDAMQVEAGPNWLGANETYIITGSPSVNEYPPGSQVEIYISCGLGEDRYRVT